MTGMSTRRKKQRMAAISYGPTEPPVNIELPQITGVFEVGQTVTCTPGVWEGADSITFQWLADGVEIPGETNDTLGLTVDYIGQQIDCRVTATNAAGSTFVVAEGEEVVFNPLVNYANGEQGVYYAPWDISTLWQDDARTVPVENYGDPVRVMDDLSPNGNHAVAPTSAARGTYGRMPAGVGRRNMANHSEEPTMWGSAGCEITSAGDLGALVTVTSGGESGAEVTPVERMLGFVKYRIWVAESDSEWLYVNTTRQTGGQRRAWVSLKTLEVHPATHSDYSEISAEVDGEFIRVDLVINTAPDGVAYPRLYRLSASGEGGVLPSVGDSVYVKKVDIRYLDQDGPYQRVGNQYDVSQEGVPDVYYIETDGIDDCYQTAPIDLTMYDSTSLAVGVQNLSVGSTANMLVELSHDSRGSSAAGSYAVFRSSSTGRPWAARHRGTTNITVTGTEEANEEVNVLSMSASISEPDLTAILQGELLKTTASQGTGTLGDYSLNLLSRNADSLFFQGRFFGAIIVHPRPPYEEQNRQFLAKKAGVTL